jgi:hypothetical protein
VTAGEQLLESANSVLLLDWPSRDAPDTLARAGYEVVVKGGIARKAGHPTLRRTPANRHPEAYE